MDDLLVLKGLAVGFVLAAPVGPIALLCVRRTMAEGRLSGFLSGAGAATADSIYGFAAALGMSLLSRFLEANRSGIQVAGGVLLCLVGVRTFFARPPEEGRALKWHGHVGNYFSALLLTLTNPMTFVAFAAVLASIGHAAGSGGLGAPGRLAAGVFVGSGLWWSLLVLGTNTFRSRFTLQKMLWMDRVAGVLITLLGFTYLAAALLTT